MIGMFVYDGVRYVRIDQIESIGETVDEHVTDRYATDPRTVKSYTRHVRTINGTDYDSPGTADELIVDIQHAFELYEARMREAYEAQQQAGQD